ncbi:MAG: hypothetical protein CMB99_00865 [Flavobacteriaceae bacterium]|nr:hypothetical protein [Flavobacteriaceae bacterium]|tara:strand:+ start:898 stop:1329 length:432 start_codon:yes stop_codon:yes gene_type:complete
MNIVDLIALFEGYRARAYHCSEGYPTIGYGKKLGPKGAPLDFYQLEVSERVAKFWLEEDIRELAPVANTLCPGLDGVRHGALISMVYQMGERGVKKFKKMLSALAAGDWQRAHDEALDSVWANQTPHRAQKTAIMLLTGEWPA